MDRNPTISAWFGILLAATSLCAIDEPPKGKPVEANPAAPAVAAAPAEATSGRLKDEKEIRDVATTFAEAFLNGDPRAIAENFVEDGEAIDAEGGTIPGRQAIEEHYAARFADSPGDKLESARPAESPPRRRMSPIRRLGASTPPVRRSRWETTARHST